ncbi:AAA family ATPase [Cypionkella sp.]|uniref:AAA family ATPase n=1 Tax=Cypionkella sp. TaxID=2811411 RepID=UPI002FDDE8D5
MTNLATLQPEPAPILACTISRDVQNFEMLIDEMEDALGENWGDLSFDHALSFLEQPEAATLRFVALAVNAADETDLALISDILRCAKSKAIRAILVVDQLGPVALHQLLRLGAEEFVPYPLPQGMLQEVIARLQSPAPAPSAAAAPVHAAAPPPPETGASFKAKGDRNAVVLPVHGLAGGCGASNFAVNLAWELACVEQAEPLRVCLLDLDFQYGAVATYLDLPRKEAVFELLSDIANADSDSLVAAMQTFKDRLHVLTAPADMLPLDIVSAEDITRLLDMARANFDYVVIDMPKTIVAWTETVLGAAHVYFALMDLDLRSAQNVLRLNRALKAEGLAHEKLRFVLNRAPKFTDLSGKSRVKRMAESLDISIEAQLPDGGSQISQANDHGLPLAETAAKNPLRKDIAKLAKTLVDLNKIAEQAKA